MAGNPMNKRNKKKKKKTKKKKHDSWPYQAMGDTEVYYVHMGVGTGGPQGPGPP